MTDEERRGFAWDQALYAEGTRAIFDRRATQLRRWTRVRDFIGIAVPFILAYFLGSELLDVLKPYRHIATGLVVIGGLLQALIVVWSILSRWDEELTSDILVVRESNFLKDTWQRIGMADTPHLEADYGLARRLQEVADSHVSTKMITDREKRMGMRVGLVEFKRKCAGCDQQPRSRSVPKKPTTKCDICGGN